MSDKIPTGLRREISGRLLLFFIAGDTLGAGIYAIVVTTAAAAVLVLTGDLASLAQTVVLLLLVVFTFVNLSVLRLRRMEHDDTDHFRAPS